MVTTCDLISNQIFFVFLEGRCAMMTDQQVGYLCTAAASLPNAQSSRSLTLLRSYYLMKCKEITNGHGLPDKIFSHKARCSRCCTEWRRGTQTTVYSIKLSKRQRQRIKSLKAKEDKKPHPKSRLELLHSMEMKQLCNFCKQSTVTTVPKPKKVGRDGYIKIRGKNVPVIPRKDKSVAETKAASYKKTKQKSTPKKLNEINVYSPAKDAFSLSQKNNTLAASIEEVPKLIKNNKKKKDKFAGLCAKAVLASAKLKEEKEKQNKLSLFLKPSI